MSVLPPEGILQLLIAEENAGAVEIQLQGAVPTFSKLGLGTKFWAETLKQSAVNSARGKYNLIAGRN
jgi:hypothetical protein